MTVFTHDILLLIISLLHILLLSSSLQNFADSAPQGMLIEQHKIRLGSTPPSCHNHCNECNPCKPVQVPTLPTVPARMGRPMHLPVDRPTFNQYSNYKPLGWKCRCGDRLFDP